MPLPPLQPQLQPQLGSPSKALAFPSLGEVRGPLHRQVGSIATLGPAEHTHKEHRLDDSIVVLSVAGAHCGAQANCLNGPFQLETLGLKNMDKLCSSGPLVASDCVFSCALVADDSVRGNLPLVVLATALVTQSQACFGVLLLTSRMSTCICIWLLLLHISTAI